MADYTNKYNLILPAEDDYYDINQYNSNVNSIDTILYDKIDKVTGAEGLVPMFDINGGLQSSGQYINLRGLSENTDLDDVKDSGWYWINEEGDPAGMHLPEGTNGFVKVVFNKNKTRGIQIFYRYGSNASDNNGNFFRRTYQSSTGWGHWWAYQGLRLTKSFTNAVFAGIIDSGKIIKFSIPINGFPTGSCQVIANNLWIIYGTTLVKAIDNSSVTLTIDAVKDGLINCRYTANSNFISSVTSYGAATVWFDGKVQTPFTRDDTIS